MNAKEIISSGLLEAYLLEELSLSERMEVEEWIESSEEVRQEVRQIEITLEALAYATAIKPTGESKELILSKIGNKAANTSISRQFNFYQYLSAASIGLLLIFAGLTFLFWSKWKNTENQLSSVIAENQLITERFNTSNKNLADTENQLAFVQLPEVKKIELKGTTNAPIASSTVFWNSATNETYLSVGQLEALPKAFQYQLWAIIDGKPVDAGLINSINVNSLLKMENIGGRVAAFAITIEPVGGSESPTLEKMQVLGNV